MGGLEFVHPALRERIEWIQSVARYYGVDTVVTSGYRSFAEQSALYEARGSNPYPVSPPGCTSHELGLAVDLVATQPQYQAGLQYLGSYAGLYSPPQDPIHFSLLSPTDLVAYKAAVCGAQP